MSSPVPGNINGDYISRAEHEQFLRTYEVRHAELRNEVKEVEVELKGQLNQLNLKLDTLSTQLANRGTDTWKLIAMSLSSGIGGYLLFYTQHLFIK